MADASEMFELHTHVKCVNGCFGDGLIMSRFLHPNGSLRYAVAIYMPIDPEAFDMDLGGGWDWVLSVLEAKDFNRAPPSQYKLTLTGWKDTTNVRK